ncbi:hypothetical protein QN277_023495 [Acacia crassicarpa]|uniref:Uncharacterized protein n=1 Tax=Acacia crassicarpa TaxID=499986 RepID=A0AAE1MM15_9FABA|nr:hypothetical protein QN277_023495 [Acacia crassicarpa]
MFSFPIFTEEHVNPNQKKHTLISIIHVLNLTELVFPPRTQLEGLSLEEEECKNSMQSSTASTRCESVGSDKERDLTKVDEEETFLDDLLLMETTLTVALATFAPSRSRNLTGENLESFGSRKVQVPIILFLFPNTLPLRSPFLRNKVGFSFTSGLKHTLLLFVDIFV